MCKKFMGTFWEMRIIVNNKANKVKISVTDSYLPLFVFSFWFLRTIQPIIYLSLKEE